MKGRIRIREMRRRIKIRHDRITENEKQERTENGK